MAALLALSAEACSGSRSDAFQALDGGADAGANMDGGHDTPPRDSGPLTPSKDSGAEGARDGSSDGQIGPGGDAAPRADARTDAGALDAGSDAAALDASTDTGALDAGKSSSMVFSSDFEDNALPAGLDPGAGLLTPSQDFAPLGSPGNTFGPTFLRSGTGNVVTLTLSNLPAHTSISLAFLFAAIDSLDGTGSPPSDDNFRVTLDGVTFFRESFANATDSEIQSYDTPPPPPGVVLARRVDLGFSGPGGYYTDSAYDFSLEPRFQNWPHSASNAVFTFTIEGQGVQDLADESWAIDNLRVTVGDTPRANDGG